MLSNKSKYIVLINYRNSILLVIETKSHVLLCTKSHVIYNIFILYVRINIIYFCAISQKIYTNFSTIENLKS